MSTTVRTATSADVSAVAAVLADAFFDDPVISWILPDRSSRIRRAQRMFAADARHQMVPLGTTDLVDVDGRVCAAAMWTSPTAPHVSLWTALRMMPGLMMALGRNLPAGRSVSKALAPVRPREPHWYLSAIGTHTTARAAGHGSALLRSRLARCDAEGAPAYLESSNKENVPYYQRFGFEVIEEIVVPDGGPTLWAMWRRPR